MNPFDLALKSMLNAQGEKITYFQGEKHKNIKGIFKRSYKLIDGETAAEMLFEDEPNLKISLSALLPFVPAQGDRVTRDSFNETYQVDRVVKDSQVGARLILKKGKV